MRIIKRILVFLLALALLVPLCACGKAAPGDDAELVVIGQPQVSAETEPGYVTTELPMPVGYEDLGGLQSCGNDLYLHARTQDGAFAVLRYDTQSDEWKSWDLDTGEAKNPRIEAFSAVEDAVWIRLMEGYSEEEVLRKRFLPPAELLSDRAGHPDGRAALHPHRLLAKRERHGPLSRGACGPGREAGDPER